MTQLGASACEQESTNGVPRLTITHAQARGPAMIDSVEPPLSSNQFGPFGVQGPGNPAIQPAGTLTIFDTVRSVILVGSVCRPIHTRPHPSARTTIRTFLKQRQ